MASKATLKADAILKDENIEFELSWKDKIRLVWKVYIPAIGSGVVTVGSIIYANRIGAKKAAAFAAAYGISERAFQEYKEKIVEKFGENKARTVKDELAQKRIDEHPISKEVIIAGSGDVLCFDILSGRYFMSSVEKIRSAENKNQRIHHSTYVL